MVQINRVSLPDHQCVYNALSRIFGLGPATSLAVIESCGISKGVRVRDLKENHITQLSQFIQDNYVTEDNLKRKIRQDIVAKVDVKSWEGIRHKLGLGLRGNANNMKTGKKLRFLEMYDVSRK